MPNTLDVGSGREQGPKEAVEAVNTTEARAMGSFKLRAYGPRHVEHTSWPSRSGESQFHEVFRFSTLAITLCAAIQAIWSLVLRGKTPNAWRGLVERRKAWTIKTPSLLTNKYARSGFFAAPANLTPLLEGSSASAKAMFATSIIAGGA